jgi:hypothetical protein
MAQRQFDEYQKEFTFLEKARERMSKSFTMSGPKIEPANFEKEIGLLTAEVNTLNKQQEILKDSLIREQETLSSLRLQIDMAADALKQYDGDSAYLTTVSQDGLKCPTCGAEHDESFMDMLGFTEDARVLRDLVVLLKEDETKISKKYLATRGQLDKLSKNYARVSEILDTRRGELGFSEVLQSMGAEQAFKAFNVESTELKRLIDELLSSIEIHTRDMKALVSPARSKKINDKFRDYYRSALHDLNMPPVGPTKLSLRTRPDVSGSGGPRSLLAYYGAIWHACLGEHGDFSIPLVIDSPNQQGQDDLNLPKVLEYLSSSLPSSAQVIVGTEMDTPAKFDSRIILSNPYQILDEEPYEEVSATVDPLIKVMFDSLKRQDAEIPLLL